MIWEPPAFRPYGMDSPRGRPLLPPAPREAAPVGDYGSRPRRRRDALLVEGWYLMSPAELEAELPHLNDPDVPGPVSGAVALDPEEALAFKRAGNQPDALGRWLRL